MKTSHLLPPAYQGDCRCLTLIHLLAGCSYNSFLNMDLSRLTPLALCLPTLRHIDNGHLDCSIPTILLHTYSASLRFRSGNIMAIPSSHTTTCTVGDSAYPLLDMPVNYKASSHNSSHNCIHAYTPQLSLHHYVAAIRFCANQHRLQHVTRFSPNLQRLPGISRTPMAPFTYDFTFWLTNWITRYLSSNSMHLTLLMKHPHGVAIYNVYK